MSETLPAPEETQPEVFESLKQAAGAKNLSVCLLKLAKTQGAPGFRGSRIYWAELEPWLTAHLEELTEAGQDKDYWVLRKLKAEALTKELALEKEKGLLIPKADVSAQLLQLASMTRGVLKTLLEDELPSKLAGLNAIAIREEMRRAVDSVCANIQKGLKRGQGRTIAPEGLSEPLGVSEALALVGTAPAVAAEPALITRRRYEGQGRASGHRES